MNYPFRNTTLTQVIHFTQVLAHNQNNNGKWVQEISPLTPPFQQSMGILAASGNWRGVSVVYFALVMTIGCGEKMGPSIGRPRGGVVEETRREEEENEKEREREIEMERMCMDPFGLRRMEGKWSRNRVNLIQN